MLIVIVFLNRTRLPFFMRLIAAGDTYWEFEKIKNYISEIGEGIVLFSEGSFDEEKGLNWTVNDLATYTQNLPMTLIGEKENRIHIVKNGVVSRAQLGFEVDQDHGRYNFVDYPRDVSYQQNRQVMALSRICADAIRPYERNGLADLLLVASGGADWQERLDELLDVHEKKLKPNALIVQCDHGKGTKFIYSLAERKMVGETKIGAQGDDYIVHTI